MNRAPSTPGRIAFVGSGPGDPGLLTVRAREALAAAPLVVTDPDVPDGVRALIADRFFHISLKGSSELERCFHQRDLYDPAAR